MGVTFIKVKVTNPAKPQRSKAFDFLVDSGALYTVMPADDLKQLGIKPTSKREFRIATGELIQRQVGSAEFEYKGLIGAAPVVFGDPDVYLLGVTTLESLGLMLDPIGRDINPMPMPMMVSGPRHRTLAMSLEKTYGLRRKGRRK